MTGLPLDTLRAWERRYKVVQPLRVPRGRLYSDSDIRRLLLLRAAVEGGHGIGQVAALSDADLQGLARASFPPVPKPPSGAAAAPAVLQPVLTAIESWDYAAANEELGRLAALANPRTLVHDMVLPLMRIAGQNWENGRFQVAQEHMLSACVRNLLGGLIRLQTPHPRQPAPWRILFTTPSTEQHEFGILAAALLAAAHDIQVTYLGPNLPAQDIVSVTERQQPDVVVLGIMKTNVTPLVLQQVSFVGLHLPAGVELWLGGTGAADCRENVRPREAYLLDDFLEFERQLARLTSARAAEPPR